MGRRALVRCQAGSRGSRPKAFDMLRAQGNTLQRCSTFLPPLSLLHHPQRSEGSCQSSPRLGSDVNIERCRSSTTTTTWWTPDARCDRCAVWAKATSTRRKSVCSAKTIHCLAHLSIAGHRQGVRRRWPWLHRDGDGTPARHDCRAGGWRTRRTVGQPGRGPRGSASSVRWRTGLCTCTRTAAGSGTWM